MLVVTNMRSLKELYSKELVIFNIKGYSEISEYPFMILISIVKIKFFISIYC